MTVAPASLLYLLNIFGRYSTNWDRKGWPGLEIQIYYRLPVISKVYKIKRQRYTGYTKIYGVYKDIRGIQRKNTGSNQFLIEIVWIQIIVWKGLLEKFFLTERLKQHIWTPFARAGAEAIGGKLFPTELINIFYWILKILME